MKGLLLATCVVSLCVLSAPGWAGEPVGWESVGLGGGGSMYSPAASPHDPNLIFMSCDMGGFYRTEDGGKTWRMVPWWVNQGSTVCRPVFHPTDANVVFASGKGLMVSRDRGVTWVPCCKRCPGASRRRGSWASTGGTRS